MSARQIVLDTETTGLNPRLGDRVIELGCVEILSRRMRELHPGKKNSLDALCERYFVDHSNRTLHGALLDARLLAECYLAMTRGQESLVMELETPAAAAAALAALQVDVSNLVVLRALPEEVALHEKYLDGMEKEAKNGVLWRRILKTA